MQNIFAGKNIVVGVTGSIAAFKVAGWVSTLAKDEADVHVIMTDAAQKFVSGLTFSAISGNHVHTSMFTGVGEDSMAHITLGREADVILIAPATANSIAKLAHGLADNLLETTVLATQADVIICPAMNSKMYNHPATQKNLSILRELGCIVILPDCGTMACKEEGQGRLPEWERVVEYLARSISVQDFTGKKVVVTAGPTREAIDPARFLSNRSSGKMGYALAQAAYRRGAEVVLISGPTTLSSPEGVVTIRTESAEEMHGKVLEYAEQSDIVIKAAAVSDYRPATRYEEKIKKNQIDNNLELLRNPDILLELGRVKKNNQLLVGFAAESQNHLSEGRKKLEKKNLDLIAINDIHGDNTGFESDTNQIHLVSKDDKVSLPLTSKLHTANLILDRISVMAAKSN